MATKTPTIQDAFDKNKYDLATAAKKSRSWYEQQVLLLTRQRITPPQLLRAKPRQLKTTVMPGKLYMFMYDPKLKAVLPYYDKFPLVFPFRRVPGGFLGLNMHYLPYQLRIRLLDRLMMFASNDKMNAATRIKYSWQLINGVSQFAAAKPCVKHYLADHLRSEMREVPSFDWATAMLLPVERFVGATKEEVWFDSQKIMRRS